MRKWILLLAMALLLSGCAAAETYETLADEMDTPAMGQEKQVVLTLPDSAASPVVNTETGSRLFICNGYDLTVQTLAGGDMKRTVKILCGYEIEQLTVMESVIGGQKRYEWVWTAAGEGGDQIGRAMVISDGSYHYCLCAMADAVTAGVLEAEWSAIFSSVTLA